MNEFLKLYAIIKRDGARELLEYLVNKTDFFTAPASTKFHGAVEGGLVAHSIGVYKRLKEITKMDNESIAIVSLLHDLCKTKFYKKSFRNVKNETTGIWDKIPCYVVEDSLPFGHGEKSVYIINKFMRLTDEEALAIRWHMGGFDEAVKGGSYAMNNAFNNYKLPAMLHIADMLATYCDEAV